MNLTQKSGESDKLSRKIPLVIEGATPALGQASQAIKFGDYVIISGQLPIAPDTNKIVGNDIESQTEACIKSLEVITDFIGGALSNVLKVTIFVTAFEDLPAMEKVYKTYFQYQPPARTIVGVSKLPMNARIQIDAMIYAPQREKSNPAF
ncbi:reactive intermediate/imine deaminase [Candidatus Sumerlaeota bacterium]|nr:reactive intermediate/imine deaminase [Candidatus Sumerlaeota bacterium]